MSGNDVVQLNRSIVQRYGNIVLFTIYLKAKKVIEIGETLSINFSGFPSIKNYTSICGQNGNTILIGDAVGTSFYVRIFNAKINSGTEFHVIGQGFVGD